MRAWLLMCGNSIAKNIIKPPDVKNNIREMFNAARSEIKFWSFESNENFFRIFWKTEFSSLRLLKIVQKNKNNKPIEPIIPRLSAPDSPFWVVKLLKESRIFAKKSKQWFATGSNKLFILKAYNSLSYGVLDANCLGPCFIQ